MAAYWRHVEEIADQFPPHVRSLARDVNLHDGLVRAITADSASGILEMRLRCGDLQVGYFDLNIAYFGVRLTDAAAAQLATIVHDYETEILYDEIDIGDDGRFVHRLLFWPRGEIVIPFVDLSFEQHPADSRRFRARSPRFQHVPERAPQRIKQFTEQVRRQPS